MLGKHTEIAQLVKIIEEAIGAQPAALVDEFEPLLAIDSPGPKAQQKLAAAEQ